MGGIKRCSVCMRVCIFYSFKQASERVPGRVYVLQSRGEYVHGQLTGLSSGQAMTGLFPAPMGHVAAREDNTQIAQ